MRLRLTLALIVIALFAWAPSAEARGCINHLPVTHSFNSNYAPSYKGTKMVVKVTSQGSWIHHVKAELYTFEGVQIAKSRVYEGGFNTTKRVKMKLLYGAMQTGKYTLVITGEPNYSRSCGPKRYTKVVQFSDCPKGLPVEFPNLPGGKAGAYGRWLSVFLKPVSGVLRNVRLELYDFNSNFFGRAKLKALFGTAKMDIKLRHKLVNGSYNLIVKADGGPRGCRRAKQTKKTITFGKKQSGGGGGGDDDEGGGFGGSDDGYGDDGFSNGGNGGSETGETDGDGFGGGTQGGDGTDA